MTSPYPDGHPPLLRHIPCSFNNADFDASARRLVFSLFPEWEKSEGEVKFTRFTDGITNTVCHVRLM